MDKEALKRIPQGEFYDYGDSPTKHKCAQCGERDWQYAIAGMAGRDRCICAACHKLHPPGSPPEVPEHDKPVRLTGEWKVPEKGKDWGWLSPGKTPEVCYWEREVGGTSLDIHGGNRWILELVPEAEEWPKWVVDGGFVYRWAGPNTCSCSLSAEGFYWNDKNGEDGWDDWCSRHECTEAHAREVMAADGRAWPKEWGPPEQVGEWPQWAIGVAGVYGYQVARFCDANHYDFTSTREIGGATQTGGDWLLKEKGCRKVPLAEAYAYAQEHNLAWPEGWESPEAETLYAVPKYSAAMYASLAPDGISRHHHADGTIDVDQSLCVDREKWGRNLCWNRCTREEALARVMPAKAEKPEAETSRTRCDVCGEDTGAWVECHDGKSRCGTCYPKYKTAYDETDANLDVPAKDAGAPRFRKEQTMSTNNEVMEYDGAEEVACPKCGVGLSGPSKKNYSSCGEPRSEWRLSGGLLKRKCDGCKAKVRMYPKSCRAPLPPIEDDPGIEKVAKAHRKAWEPDALVTAGQSIVGGVGILAWTLLNIAAKTTGFALRRVVRPSVGWVAHRYGGAAALFVLACLAWQYPSGATRVAGSVANGVVVAANAIGSAWAWCAGLVG